MLGRAICCAFISRYIASSLYIHAFFAPFFSFSTCSSIKLLLSSLEWFATTLSRLALSSSSWASSAPAPASSCFSPSATSCSSSSMTSTFLVLVAAILRGVSGTWKVQLYKCFCSANMIWSPSARENSTDFWQRFPLTVTPLLELSVTVQFFSIGLNLNSQCFLEMLTSKRHKLTSWTLALPTVKEPDSFKSLCFILFTLLLKNATVILV